MAFLKVDMEKESKRGSVFVAQVGKKLVIGRSTTTSLNDAVLVIAAKIVAKGVLPSITLVKFKKVPNTHAAESLLHSMLHKYKEDKAEYYIVPASELDRVWEEL